MKEVSSMFFLHSMKTSFPLKNLLLSSLKPGNPYSRGRLSTIDLLVQTNLDHLIVLMKILFTFFYKKYLNEEVNCTEPFPSVSIPCESRP
jgi:hypothetical protein